MRRRARRGVRRARPRAGGGRGRGGGGAPAADSTWSWPTPAWPRSCRWSAATPRCSSERSRSTCSASTTRCAPPGRTSRTGAATRWRSPRWPLRVHPPLLGAYCASKAGVEALADSLRIELAPSGARVGVAYFAELDTDMVRQGFGTEAARRMSEIGPRRRPVTPLEAGIDAIERGIARRSRRVVAPRWVAPLLPMRMLAQRVRRGGHPLLDRGRAGDCALGERAADHAAAARLARSARLGCATPSKLLSASYRRSDGARRTVEGGRSKGGEPMRRIKPLLVTVVATAAIAGGGAAIASAATSGTTTGSTSTHDHAAADHHDRPRTGPTRVRLRATVAITARTWDPRPLTVRVPRRRTDAIGDDPAGTPAGSRQARPISDSGRGKSAAYSRSHGHGHGQRSAAFASAILAARTTSGSRCRTARWACCWPRSTRRSR